MIGSQRHLDEDRLRRLIDAGRSLVAERDLDRVLDRVRVLAQQLTGARHVAVDTPEDARIAAGESFLRVPILVEGKAWGSLHLSDKEGGPFDAADEEAIVVLAAWAAVAIENATVYRDTHQRRLELERSLRALQATSELAQAVGGETRLWRVLEMIARQSQALIDASGVVILLSDGDELEIAATAGEIPEDLIGVRFPVSRAAATRVLATGRSERVADLSTAPSFALRELGVNPTAALFVPLFFHGLQVGVIEAFDRIDGPHFRGEDERMLVAVGTSAAAAVATARSVERERLRRTLKAAESERSRWARELHDDTLQGLGVLRVLLSNARRSDDVATLHARLDGAVDQLTQEIANLRSLITELRPAALDELGLAPALEALFERTRVAYGLVIDGTVELIEDDEPPRLDPEVETAVYRVVQESLTNAARHAEADYVAVEVLRRGDTIRIAVGDDGSGFDVEQPSSGFGLTGMRERISLAGGRLEIKTSPAGTTILASLPCGDSSSARRR
jgi:two-component system, NarL family, sensor histidine kinase DevS